MTEFNYCFHISINTPTSVCLFAFDGTLYAYYSKHITINYPLRFGQPLIWFVGTLTHFLVDLQRSPVSLYVKSKSSLEWKKVIKNQFPAVLVVCPWSQEGEQIKLNQLWNHVSLFWRWKIGYDNNINNFSEYRHSISLRNRVSISRQPDLLNGCQVCTENVVLPQGVVNNPSKTDHLATSSVWYLVRWTVTGL